MYKLEFTLKQHTPLIHFQHDQAGATLRATEVKPKLDKYIINNKGGWEKIPNEWRVGNQKAQHEALNYSIRIIIPPQTNLLWFPDENEKLNFPCFFANMGEENQEKYKLCCFDQPIKLEITALNVSLRTEILKLICTFFVSHTFGTRQSKGFGFYYPLKESPAFQNNSYFKLPSSSYSFTINLLRSDNLWEIKKDAFEYIDLFYRLLRSGLNRKKGPQFIKETINGKDEYINDRDTLFYCKPILFKYLKSESKQWDKKSIKAFFFDQDYYKRLKLDRKEKDYFQKKEITVKSVLEYGLPQQINKHKESDLLLYNQPAPHYLWRDLFGLSTDESWKSYDMNIEKTHAKKVSTVWQPKSNNEPDKIARFKSPLQFIPFFTDDKKSCRVFFFCKEIPQEYLNSIFLVSNGTSSIPLKIGNMKSIKPIIDWLLIPGNFDLKENWSGITNCSEYAKLAQVLSSLKKIQS